MLSEEGTIWPSLRPCAIMNTLSVAYLQILLCVLDICLHVISLISEFDVQAGRVDASHNVCLHTDFDPFWGMIVNSAALEM